MRERVLPSTAADDAAAGANRTNGKPRALRPVQLTDNARTVLTKRYLRRGEDGKPAETVEEMFWRVAYHIALPDGAHGGDVERTAEQFYDLLTSLRFFPNSPTFTGAGTPLAQLAACFVLPIDDDMGRTGSGIFETLRNAALIQQTGGGNGFSFSRLRPKSDHVKTSGGAATGPVGFLRVYDKAFGEVAQGGSRRGANMSVLRVDHPDIEEFIACKTDENHITNFNISVALTDGFMRAVEDDEMFDLVNPRDGKVWRSVRARELFRKIVKQAHHNGEPGALFIDAANRSNPVPQLYELEATNPCVTGETLVATPHGWRHVESICEGDEVCTVLGTGRVTTIEIHENVPVYDVHLSDGGVVRATAAHQFHVRDSRQKFFEPRRLDALQPGDWVRVYRATVPNNRVPPTSVDLTDREYGFLVGVLVGDGCYTAERLAKNVVRISTHVDDHEWNEMLRSAFAKVGTETMREYVVEGSHAMTLDPKPGRVIASWVKSLPLEPARGPQKRLPEVYINSNREFLAGLLDGLFSTDGSVDLQSNHPLLRFHTASSELARQVRRILLMFGIHGRISESQRKRHEIGGRVIRYDRPKYDVVISGASLGRFFEQISLSHPDKRMRLEEAALTSNFTGGNWAARVVKIEPAGTDTVFDLYEPRSDSWITEGYVSRGCGEQWLGPYENCCLGSINLAQYVTPEGEVDWAELEAGVALATRFLDNVVDANEYVPAVPQLKEAAHRVRRIGLGIMGLADMMYRRGVRYGSEEGQEFAAQIMEFVRYHCMRTSIELAQARGPFPAIVGSIYDPDDFKWKIPQPLVPHTRDWGRPALDWAQLERDLRRHGIRNGATLTSAPTGTIATVAGCEGYGCEPVFALAYVRHVNDHGKDIELRYLSPLFERALVEAGVNEDARKRIMDEVLVKGSCQDIDEVPASIRHMFVVSSDITGEEHVRMQAALQAFVDNSISKCVVGDTLVLTTRGLVPIAELSDMRLPDQFEPMGLDVVTPSGIQKATAFYYGGMRETRRVRLSYGYQVEGTPNHRVQIVDDTGQVRFAQLDELKLGDTVVLYGGQQVFGPGSQSLPRYSGTLATRSKAIRFPERMSADLAYVLGCITSEGAITRNGLAITNGDRDLLERLGKLFEQLFGFGTNYIFQDPRRESVFTLQVNSRALRNWLLADLGLQTGARNKIVPACILGASRTEIAAFLRGLLLDRYMTRDGRLFGIGLASLKLLQQLQVLFLNFGVVSSLRRAAAHAWALTVQGAALDRLAAFVEFEEVWKTQRISVRNEGRHHRLSSYIDLMPQPLTQALRRMQDASTRSLRSLYGEQTPAYQRARVNLLRGHRLDRQTANTLYRHFDDTPDPYARSLLANDCEECIYVEVQGIDSGFAEVFDLSVEEVHSFVANGLGNHNTCNFPADATEDDVAKVYNLAWKLGCKGLTVYVTGSREKVVLETHETKAKKSKPAAAPAAAHAEGEFVVTKKPRPRTLPGKTFRMATPLGTAYITVNENGGGQPFEVFVSVGKAGSDTAAVAEAIGRLISFILRLPSPQPAMQRLRQVVHQLGGIGGGRSLGFGPQRVRSLPDGVAQALAEYVGDREASGAPSPAAAGAEPAQLALEFGGGEASSTPEPAVMVPEPVQLALKFGDLCPECGQASVVNEEGCRKCYTPGCGYSEC